VSTVLVLMMTIVEIVSFFITAGSGVTFWPYCEGRGGMIIVFDRIVFNTS